LPATKTPVINFYRVVVTGDNLSPVSLYRRLLIASIVVIDDKLNNGVKGIDETLGKVVIAGVDDTGYNSSSDKFIPGNNATGNKLLPMSLAPATSQQLIPCVN
jgi:hypothetical protein